MLNGSGLMDVFIAQIVLFACVATRIRRGKVRKIVEYTVIAQDDGNHFLDLIQKMIDEGWQPWGNFLTSEDWPFMQAMVKHEPE